MISPKHLDEPTHGCINVFLLIDDANAKENVIERFWLPVVQENTNLNIISTPKIKKVIKCSDPRYNSLNELNEKVYVNDEGLLSIQEACERNFGDKKFIVVVTDEPKCGNLLAALRYYDHFPNIGFLPQNNDGGMNLKSSITMIKREETQSFDKLPKNVQSYLWKRSYNYLPPTTIMEESWTLAQRVLINMILNNEATTLTFADIEKWKQEANIKINLKSAIESFSSPQNEKLHILENKMYPHNSNQTTYHVNRSLLDSIFHNAMSDSLLAPIISKLPAIAYNAYVEMNHDAYIKLLGKNPTDEELDATVTIIPEEEEKDGVFALNKNLPITAYKSENASTFKVSQDYRYGEFLNDKQLSSKLIENFKSFTCGFALNKCTREQYLRSHHDFILNIKERIDNPSQAEITEFDYNYMRSVYNNLSSEIIEAYIHN